MDSITKESENVAHDINKANNAQKKMSAPQHSQYVVLYQHYIQFSHFPR